MKTIELTDEEFSLVYDAVAEWHDTLGNYEEGHNDPADKESFRQQQELSVVVMQKLATQGA